MSFLNTIRPILRGSDSVTLTITGTPEGSIAVVLTSRITQCDPDTTDASRAALQAALALPLRIVIPACEDADAALQAALQRYEQSRAPVVDALQSLLDSLTEAKRVADEARAAKSKKTATTTTTTKPKASTPKPASASAAANDDDDDSDADGAADTAAHADTGKADPAPPTAPPTSAPQPAPMAAMSLFD